MLATIEHEELRYTLIREDKATTGSRIIHEMVNPLLYLRLECHANGLCSIHYGFEQNGNDRELNSRTAFFTRYVYKLTSKEVTVIDIEQCVHNDWCITQCSELYEYVEEQMKHHEFHLIKYKASSAKRKQMKAVA